MQTHKNHFTVGLSRTDPSFHHILWDTLIKQSNITINLLRNSLINLKLSAHAQIFGQFNYDSTPLAPPGCKCAIHEKPSDRGTCEIHSVKAYYIEPSIRNYRCYEVYVEKTLAKRMSEKITFLPQNIRIPNTISKKSALEKLRI